MNTLAFGYVIPAIRAYSGLAPVRQYSCRAYTQEAPASYLTGALSLKGGGYLLSRIALQYHRRKWA